MGWGEGERGLIEGERCMEMSVMVVLAYRVHCVIPVSFFEVSCFNAMPRLGS